MSTDGIITLGGILAALIYIAIIFRRSHKCRHVYHTVHTTHTGNRSSYEKINYPFCIKCGADKPVSLQNIKPVDEYKRYCG